MHGRSEGAARSIQEGLMKPRGTRNDINNLLIMRPGNRYHPDHLVCSRYVQSPTPQHGYR